MVELLVSPVPTAFSSESAADQNLERADTGAAGGQRERVFAGDRAARRERRGLADERVDERLPGRRVDHADAVGPAGWSVGRAGVRVRPADRHQRAGLQVRGRDGEAADREIRRPQVERGGKRVARAVGVLVEPVAREIANRVADRE
jgi:hypothetical protein